MRQLAEKMQIAPESLSRAINGNPQLSTIQSIATNLNVEVVFAIPNTAGANRPNSHCRVSRENPCDGQYKLPHRLCLRNKRIVAK